MIGKKLIVKHQIIVSATLPKWRQRQLTIATAVLRSIRPA